MALLQLSVASLYDLLSLGELDNFQRFQSTALRCIIT